MSRPPRLAAQAATDRQAHISPAAKVYLTKSLTLTAAADAGLSSSVGAATPAGARVRWRPS